MYVRPQSRYQLYPFRKYRVCRWALAEVTAAPHANPVVNLKTVPKPLKP